MCCTKYKFTAVYHYTTRAKHRQASVFFFPEPSLSARTAEGHAAERASLPTLLYTSPAAFSATCLGSLSVRAVPSDWPDLWQCCSANRATLLYDTRYAARATLHACTLKGYHILAWAFCFTVLVGDGGRGGVLSSVGKILLRIFWPYFGHILGHQALFVVMFVCVCINSPYDMIPHPTEQPTRREQQHQQRSKYYYCRVAIIV